MRQDSSDFVSTCTSLPHFSLFCFTDIIKVVCPIIDMPDLRIASIEP